jgi:DNA-binding CsgD family transcriptional regulator
LELGPGISRIVRDLLSSSTVGDFLRAIVHAQLAYLNATGAYLAVINEDGIIEAVESYGFPSQTVEPQAKRSIWEKSATTEAILNNRTLVYQSKSDYLDAFPELENRYAGTQVATIPIWSNSIPVGAFVFGFDFEFGSIPDETDDLWVVYQILGQVLLSPPRWIFDLSKHSAGGLAEGASLLTRLDELSEHEATVLDLISRGLTNKEIAHATSYSESFIGKTNIELFKKLGVSKRRDAVRVAIAKGLLQSPKVNPEDG